MLYSPVADFHCYSLSFGNSVFSVQNVHMRVMRPGGWCHWHEADADTAVHAAVQGHSLLSDAFQSSPSEAPGMVLHP